MTKREKLQKIADKKGMVRPREAEEAGISAVYLNKLHAEGKLDRPSRGIYVLPGTDFGENQALIEVCSRVRSGTICLLSALRFHDLTTQAPYEVWLALPEKARQPRIDYPPLRIVRFSGEAMTYGGKQSVVHGGTIRVYSAAKTVADCFKYRNKIGLDVAIEALRDCWSQKQATADELWQAAKVCRMTNIMQPYMETLT
ncbi:MAG: type IV toxin-antitoxin system AbiEi family antitoxin domain-containing protein [Pirellulales bacterium]|nr:type IV toxin-antitoxin system AbiEi family antitoxin domain-containing protein [Pirellulales bacterium]